MTKISNLARQNSDRKRPVNNSVAKAEAVNDREAVASYGYRFLWIWNGDRKSSGTLRMKWLYNMSPIYKWDNLRYGRWQ